MTETLQTNPDNFQDYPEQAQFDERAIEVGVGQLALRNEVDVAEAAETDLELLNAVANGVDARPEDAGRLHDIEAAHEAALLENTIIDAHGQALAENEIFNAHAEAVKMNDEHDLAVAKAEEVEAKLVAANAANPGQKVPAADMAAKSENSANKDYRSQAEQTLGSMGIDAGKLPISSQVQKDYETGNLVITDNMNHNVQIIEPMPGGGSRVVTYDFDKAQGVVSIKAEGGNTITAKVGDYVSADDGTNQPVNVKTIKLPPSVAKAVGFSRATPLVAATS